VPCPDEQTLLEFTTRSSAAGARLEVERHLESCDRCCAVVAGLADEAAGGMAATEPDVTDEAPGRYELRAELGEGAEGRVWLAWDHHLGREVALKLPHGDGARALREARLVAQLDHPGITTVFEIGRRADGAPYSAQRLVTARSGPRSFREALNQTRTLDERLRLLPRFQQACHAMGYAHSRGVVHRDLKPEHIALGDDGSTVVLDWGLAVRTGEDVAARMVGTPGYQSPEQARGARVGPETDVFALGVILRHLLTVADDAPRPKPLVAVVHRATAVEPAARYANATELAADVTAWMTGDVVRAHHYALSEVAARTFRRYRMASLLALTVAVVAVGAAVMTRRSEAAARRALASRLFESARRAQSRGAWDEAALGSARAVELAGHEGAELMLAAAAGRSTVRARLTPFAGSPVTSVAFHAPARRLAASAADGTVGLISEGELRPSVVLTGGHRGPPSALAFSNDGARLFSGARDGTVVAWSLSSRAPALVVEAGSEVDALVAAPSAEFLAVGTEDGRVRLIGSADGATLNGWRAHRTPLHAIAISPDSQWLATGAWNGELALWSVDGGLVARFDGHHDAVNDLAIAPDGHRFASASRDRTLKVWDAERPIGTPSTLVGHLQSVSAVAWLDDRHLQSTGGDGQVRTWELEEKAAGLDAWNPVSVEGLEAPASAVVRVPGGTVVATEGGQLLRLALPPRVLNPLPPRTGQHLDLEAGALLLAEERVVVRRDPATLERLPPAQSPEVNVALVRSLSGGRRLWAGWFERTGQLFVEDAAGHSRLIGTAPHLSALVADPDERWAAAVGGTRHVELHALDEGPPGPTLVGHDSDVFAVALGRHWAVTASFDLTLGVFELPSGNRRRTLTGHWRGVRCVALSPDERRIVSGSWDKTVRVWNVETGASEAVLSNHRSFVTAVAFAPDGTRFASASSDGTVIVWKTDSSTPLLELEGIERAPRALSWSSSEVLLIGGANITRIELTPRRTTAAELELTRGLTSDDATVTHVDFGGPLVRAPSMP
jgi:WD40 repeat protein